MNGGGRIEREYGLRRKRTDLLIICPYAEDQAVQKVVLELKIRYGKLCTTLKEGLKQTCLYMDRAKTSDGHLIIFDRDPNRPWVEKIFTRSETYNKTRIQIWGM